MNRKAKRALKAVDCIMDYLVNEEDSFSSDEWKDKDGYSFRADIGHFYEGLVRFKKMLERKAKDND